MQVVLDTNVFLSALLSPHGTPNTLYEAWWYGKKFELITSSQQLSELKRASRYPKFKDILQPARVGTMINNLQRATLVKHRPVSVQLKDSHDIFLLEIAQGGNADYLITGDHRAGLHELKVFGQTRILTPQSFCRKIR